MRYSKYHVYFEERPKADTMSEIGVQSGRYRSDELYGRFGPISDAAFDTLSGGLFDKAMPTRLRRQNVSRVKDNL